MKRSILTLLTAAVCTAGLAGCSSSGLSAAQTGTESGTKGSPSTAITAGSGSTAGSGGTSGGGGTAVSRSQARLAKYLAQPSFTAPGAALDAKPLAGSTIALIAIDQTTPSLLLAAQGAKAAASGLGLKTTRFDAKDNPSDMTAGVEQAIAARASAIILVGIPVELVTSQLKQAAAARIPVINADNGQSIAPSADGLTANATPDFGLAGQLAADGAVVATEGNAKAILVGTDGITPGAELLKGLKSGMAECTTCTVVATKSVQLQDWFTTLKSTTTSLIQANPTANVVLPIYVTMASQIVPGIQQAGAGDRVKVFSTSATPDAAKLMASTPTLGGLAGDSDTQVGWFAIDQALRAMLGKPASTATVPLRYLTAETVKKEGTSEDALYGSTYRSGFQKLWGMN